MKTSTALIIILLAWAGAALADEIADKQDVCRDDNANTDDRLYACSWLLDAGGLADSGNAIVYYSRGNAYLKQKEHDLAIQDYDDAIRLDPRYVDVYNNRGLAKKRNKQFDRAIRDYDEALRLNPRYLKAYNNRGNALFDKGQMARAIEDYNEAIRLSPDYTDAYFNRGNSYQRQK